MPPKSEKPAETKPADPKISATRQRDLDAAISSITKTYGDGSIMRLGDARAKVGIAVIPTGALAVDLALGVGGVPRGRVVEIFGPESSGKTTLMLHVIASAQKAGGLAAFIADMDERGLLKETLVLAIGEFGRSPKRGVSTSGNSNSDDGRDHWPYCYTSIMAGAGIKRGYVHGKSDKTGSSPAEEPVHPMEMLATIYHAFGIDPETIVFNHLKQPRELVKAKAVTKLFA